MENAAAETPAGYRPITVRELLDAMEAAHDRMGAHNPNRQLLSAAALVIVQQAQANHALEQQLAQTPRIVLPG